MFRGKQIDFICYLTKLKNTKKHVERVENINIKVYTTNCVDNMQIDHLREWFFNPFFMKF